MIKGFVLHLLTWSKWLPREGRRLHQRLAAALFFHLLRVLTEAEVNNQRRHAMLTRGRVHGRW